MARASPSARAGLVNGFNDDVVMLEDRAGRAGRVIEYNHIKLRKLRDVLVKDIDVPTEFLGEYIHWLAVVLIGEVLDNRESIRGENLVTGLAPEDEHIGVSMSVEGGAERVALVNGVSHVRVYVARSLEFLGSDDLRRDERANELPQFPHPINLSKVVRENRMILTGIIAGTVLLESVNGSDEPLRYTGECHPRKALVSAHQIGSRACL